MIELNAVTRYYGKRKAVEELELAIAAGEIFAFLGPNGAGKTTTVKMMVSLLRPSAGSICVGGIDVERSPREANQQVGYVPDQPCLYDKLSGREFLEFSAELRGLAPRLAAQRIEREIERFELREFVDHLAESYSHGMKQRIVFASALVHDPKVLILDEPMVGLDPRNMRLVKDLLRQEARRGTAVFMSTHTLSVAEEIADRIGVIDQGHLEFLGTVAELRIKLARHDSSLEHLYLELTNGSAVHEQTDSRTARPSGAANESPAPTGRPMNHPPREPNSSD